MTSHDKTIRFIDDMSRWPAPLARPTPITPPTSVCVVEIGNPIYEATTTVVAVANSAENPKLGVKFCNFFRQQF